jgi:RND family efflux transporter MFP subunit
MRLTGILTLLLALIIVSCDQGGEMTLEDKKAKLNELQKQQRELDKEIKTLEGSIAQDDPSFVKENEVLVSTAQVLAEPFHHEIEVRGSVKSRKNISVSSEVMGRINIVNAKLGDRVARGQVLAQIDAETLRNQLAELETALDLATVVFNRQENLWNNKIGSEIQYLEAKNNKEMLERQLKTTKTQLAKATIRAPFDGTVDEVSVKEGEMAQPGFPMFRIVSFDDMYVDADISERFIARFKVGDKVQVHFPALEKTLESEISSVGNVINEKNRTFKVEIKLPANGKNLKPNLTTILKLVDYRNPDALVLPTNLIQRDATGSYVYVIDGDENKAKAKKVYVERGVSYENRTEVVAGIDVGTSVIDKGHREVADGLSVKIVN